MGAECAKLCNKSKKKELKEEEVDIVFYNYYSNLDNYYKKIEKDFNLLQYFQMWEFVLLLTYFNVEPKSDPLKKEHNLSKRECDQEVNYEEYSVFIENKIFKNFLIIKFIQNHEEDYLLYKEYLKFLFESLIESEKDYWRIKNPGSKLKKGYIKTLKKVYLFCLGLLFCSSPNNSKIDFLFNLFSNENKLIEVNESLEDFLFFLFILPSTCSLRAIKGLAEKFPKKLDGISSSEYMQKCDALEISDIIRLRDIFIRDFFKGSKFINKSQYEENFKNEGNFGWIFSAKGIRQLLEKNNDVKNNE